jgi:hypothetical protein
MSRSRTLERGVRPPSAARSLAAALALALSASSCGFIGSDMFAADLQYAAGSYDLAGELGCGPEEIRDLRIEELRSLDGSSGLFVAANLYDDWHLAALSGRMGLAAAYRDPSFNRFLGSYSDPACFVCGKTSLDGDFTYGATGTMTGCEEGSVDVAMSDAVLNYRDAGGSCVVLCAKGSGIESSSITPLEPGSYFKLLDGSVLFADSGSPRFFLLARADSGKGGDVLCLGFADAYASLSAELDGSPLATNPDIAATRIRTDYVDGGWATDDGIVLLVHGRESRIVRFAYGTGKELDSIRIDSDWIRATSFESSGARWYCYDRGTGRVKKLRTWWK